MSATEEADVAVAYCWICEAKNPVVVDVISQKEIPELEEAEMTIVFCPICEFVINLDRQVDVEWHTRESVIETGWRISGE